MGESVLCCWDAVADEILRSVCAADKCEYKHNLTQVSSWQGSFRLSVGANSHSGQELETCKSDLGKILPPLLDSAEV